MAKDISKLALFKQGKRAEEVRSKLDTVIAKVEGLTGHAIYSFGDFKHKQLLGLLQTMIMHQKLRRDISEATSVSVGFIDTFEDFFGKPCNFKDGELYPERPHNYEGARQCVQVLGSFLDIDVPDAEVQDITEEKLEKIWEEARRKCQADRESWEEGMATMGGVV